MGCCGGSLPSPGVVYRATFKDGSTADFVSRTQAVHAVYAAGGGSIESVKLDR